jgi:SAM-dependent methyltransferase
MTMSTYRWNKAEFAAGYDAAGAFIHPHYAELQQAILDMLPQREDEEFVFVDAGGGSGRLAELFLERFFRAIAVVADQSLPFLQLAEDRLGRFGGRAKFTYARLQDDWLATIPQPLGAVVSMSAIHHLAPQEKQSLYQHIYDALAPGGVLLNGDEVRPADEAAYLTELERWSEHMRRESQAGRIPPQMDEILDAWRDKNIARFGQPKQSGDDCHETIETQLGYLAQSGFANVDCPWQRQMWAVLRGRKT